MVASETIPFSFQIEQTAFANSHVRLIIVLLSVSGERRDGV